MTHRAPPYRPIATLTGGSNRSLDRAAAAVDLALKQMGNLRNEDSELRPAVKRIKVDTVPTEAPSVGYSEASPASASYASATVAPTALWWNLHAPAPSPTRSSFDELVDTVLRVSQMKPRSETLQDRVDAFCAALRLQDGPRVSLMVIEGAETLWDDLTITGRWLTIQRCLSTRGTACKVVLLSTKMLGTHHYNFLNYQAVMHLRAPGSENVEAPQQPTIVTPAPLLPSYVPFTPAPVVLMPSKLPMAPHQSLHQFIEEEQQYASSDSQSDDFSSNMDTSADTIEQPSEWDWTPAPAQVLFAPLQPAPQHPTLYNMYDAFVASNPYSSYAPYDLFPRAQPVWFPSAPVMQ